MVGTTRFELATSPTPRVRSTRLSHVPTIDLHVIREGDGGVSCRLKCTRLATCATHLPYRVGATYSFGNEPPSPKKNSFICSTKNSCASRVQGCRRYSFSSIFCRSTHSPHDFFETFLKIFWPKSESNGGSSNPSISALNRVSKTMCAIFLRTPLELPFYDAQDNCAASNKLMSLAYDIATAAVAGLMTGNE